MRRRVEIEVGGKEFAKGPTSVPFLGSLEDAVSGDPLLPKTVVDLLGVDIHRDVIRNIGLEDHPQNERLEAEVLDAPSLIEQLAHMVHLCLFSCLRPSVVRRSHVTLDGRVGLLWRVSSELERM